MNNKMLKNALFATFFILISVHGYPYSTEDDSSEEATSTESLNDTVPQDLYVIKSVVYEVGILTDADNSTDNSTETHEQVDLTFYDPKHNGSVIDLSNIPVPIQTNISGVQVTGIAPVNFGSIPLPENGTTVESVDNFPLKVPIIPNAVVSVTHNFSTSDPDTGSQIITNLPAILGIKQVNNSTISTTESTEDQPEIEHIKTGD